jgi:transposase
MEKPITYVGLDMHKYAIAVALADAANQGKVPEHGKISNTPAALRPVIRRLGHTGSDCGQVTI